MIDYSLMARNIRKTTHAKLHKCDASSIPNKRRMARKAKTKSNKIDRQELAKDLNQRLIE